MRLKAFLALTGLLLAAVIGVAAFSSSSTPTGVHKTTPVVFQKYNTGNPDAPGVPAITPKSTVNSANPTTSATYTAADVQDYILANGFPGGPVAEGGHLSIVSIQFISAQQASQAIGEDVGRPSDTLVCYVVLHGPFKVGAVSAPYGTTPVSSETFQTGEIVFDAQTGNLIMWSAGL
jgi:hypothetical protein